MTRDESRLKMICGLMRRDGAGKGNNKLPYGLCKKFGIRLPAGASPKDAWDALNGKGITEADALEYLSKHGSIKGYKPRKGGAAQSIGESADSPQNASHGLTAPSNYRYGETGVSAKKKFGDVWGAFKSIQSDIGCSVDSGLSKVVKDPKIATQIYNALYTLKNNYGIVPTAIKKSNATNASASWEAKDESLCIASTKKEDEFGKMNELFKKHIKIEEENIENFNKKYEETGNDEFKDLVEEAKKKIDVYKDNLTWKGYHVSDRHPGEEMTCTILHEGAHGIMDRKSMKVACLDKIRAMERRMFVRSGRYGSEEEAIAAADRHFENTTYTPEQTGLDFDLSYDDVKGTDGEKRFKICEKALKRATETGDIKKISKYASTEPGEFFAECFTAYVMNEDLPDYIVDMIMEYK